jgi:hypothetical protein
MSTNEYSLFASLRRLSRARRGLLIVLALSFGLFLLLRAAKQQFQPEIRSTNNSISKAVPSQTGPDTDLKAEWQRLKESSRVIPPGALPVPGPVAGGMVDGVGHEGPFISHAAELSVTTKEFSRSRSNLEEILERHHGYASKLRMVGQPSGSTLTATLRVPSSEFNSAVMDLKTLGSVEREEQTADEVTQQQADLEARLTNARNTLQRLQGRLPKFGTAVDLQRQIMAVTSEITRLEAQRTAWQNRTIFANVLFSLKEEITPPVESFGTQFRKAAVAGLSDALSSLSAIVLFVISYAPAIVVWTLLLLFPGRWISRKWRRAIEPEPEAARPAQSA